MTTHAVAAMHTAFTQGSSFLLTTHEHPDGDAIGSCLGLAHYLKGLGKRVSLYCVDPVPETYQFLPGATWFQTQVPEVAFDYCVVLDVGELGRAGAVSRWSPALGPYLNIDHHSDCAPFGLHNLIDPEACATAVLIHRLIRAAGHTFTAEVALCIYTAIVTDTGSFRHANTNPEAFAIASELLQCGVNTVAVTRQLFDDQPRQRLELLALVLPTLSFSDNGRIASLTVTQQMYAQTGATPEHAEGFVSHPRSVQGVEVAILFRELGPDLWKVGLRSHQRVDVAKVAKAFGGGGHKAAAGCTVAGSLVEVKSRVLSQLGLR